MIVERVQVGSRVVSGTTFPVENAVDKQVVGGTVRWVVLRGLCNGVPERAVTYKTKREAIAAIA